MPRGSNTVEEQDRIRRSEQSDFRESKKSAGARKNKELPAFHGSQANPKNAKAPRA